MFKKLAYFTDIHYGRNLNNPVSLKDNADFIDWFIDEAKQRNCETFIFGGDWFDNRLTINVNTLNAALEGIEKIAAAFDRSYFLLGNHDLYFREKRSVSSVTFARHIDKLTIINEPTQIGDVTFLPWLVGDEADNLPSPTRYTFAHLEMSGFMMNAKSIMPESDHALKPSALKQHGTVFTGHFHMRQIQRNVVYTGNVMPFDFSDNWDSDRGAMFLDWGGEPEFVAWPDQPVFRTTKLTDVLSAKDAGVYFRPKATIRLSMDSDVTYEQMQMLKDYYVDEFRLRKLELIPVVKQTEEVDAGEITFQTIDQIVVDGLMSVQSPGMKSDRLIALYKSLS